jgi:cyanophycinase-like exopeptidase
VSGPIGLHGGGEYLPGDERFLDALLEAAVAGVRRKDDGSPARRPTTNDTDDVEGHAVDLPRPSPDVRPSAPSREIRIAIVPTAAARGRPDVAAANGRTAFERRARLGEHPFGVRVEVARLVDAASAADPLVVEVLRSADLIHFPGGDPDLIPAILAASPALAAIDAAWRGGAVLAGASAGAMAFAEWTWTPKGGIRGLGFVRGLAVVPHYDDVRRTRWQGALDELAPGGLGYLGLDEQTGVIAVPDGSGARPWRVAGAGAAHWFARGATTPVTARHGDILELPT